jgi:3-hydroxybutyryl-CoA dehydrogenase
MAGEIARVGVVGLGTMGAGIAEVLARSGLEVVGVEVGETALARGRANLEKSTGRAVARGKLSDAAAAEILSRVELRAELAAMADVDLVVEAVPERLEIKRGLFTELDRICPPATILATNTSSLPVIEIAMATGRPDRVLGMHWFNPAPIMGLVEVVSTVRTDPTVVGEVARLASRAGKTAVRVGDRAGFIANALLFGYLNAAAAMHESGHATREDIDAAMTLGVGLPMGPLALLDLIGLDTAYEILETMYRSSGDRLHAPAPILRQLVTAGLLGRKTGRGFYAYDGSDEPVSTAPIEARPVARIGVVGGGPPATDIAASLAGGGYDVARLEPSADPGPLVDRDLAVIVGDGGSVQLSELDRALRPGAVLALMVPAGTPVVGLATTTSRPADVVGLRWRDTALVEVASTVATAPDAAAAVREVCEKAGRTVVCCRDRAGLVVDALLFPHLNAAVRMLDSGYATESDIDAAMRLGCAYPAGPFQLLDRLGWDVALATQAALYRETPEPGLAPSPLLEQLALTGRHGPGSAGR